MRNTQRTPTPPVSEGELLEDMRCISIGDKGDGVFLYGTTGFVIIVPGAKKGATYDVRVTRVLGNLAFGEIKN